MQPLLLKSDSEYEFNILKSDDLVIGGYASIEIVDKQNDLITLKALEEAVNKYMSEKKYRNVMSNHSNVQVGEVIEKYRDKSGNLHQTKVDDVGFYVVIKLRDDIEKAKEVSRGIRKGNLRSFSIGGQALSKVKKTNDTLGEYNEINKLELHEITICEKGINPEAKFDILKEDREMTEKLEKALEELNDLMKQVNELRKEGEDPEMDKGDYGGKEPEEEIAMGDYASMDTDEEEKADMDDEESEKADYDMEEKMIDGPSGPVEDGGAGSTSSGKPHVQNGQFGTLKVPSSISKEWSNDEFNTLDLSVENVEKAYEAYKAEQLEKMAYDSLKTQFAERFATEQSVRKSEVERNEYNAMNEVESLKEEFATLRKSLTEQQETIVKSATVALPEVDVSELSWGELHNIVNEYEVE